MWIASLLGVALSAILGEGNNDSRDVILSKKVETPDKAAETSSAMTCFVMMPISDVEGYPVGHFAEVYRELIEPAVQDAGYICLLANTTSAAHLIQLEVVTQVATADLCICDLSTNNPNVLFEYGIRQAFDKPTVLLKDDKTRRIFDLAGFRDIEYDHTLRIANILNARKQITSAIADTVNGNADERQIFSLVKLMKLAKAALPAGEVSTDDARFALLERKLNSISSIISNNSVFLRDGMDNSLGGTVRDGSYSLETRNFSMTFSDALIEVTYSDGRREIFTDVPSFSKSPAFSSFTKRTQERIYKVIDQYCSNVIPF